MDSHFLNRAHTSHCSRLAHRAPLVSTLRRPFVLTAALATAFALTACAGSAGGGGGGGASGEGYAFGASQEEIDAVLADLDPVTITYQTSATSMNSPQAVSATEYKKTIEERSGGKITIELAWNQSIANYDEVHDALADGRIGMALTIPSYDPAEFPAFNALNDILAGDASPPMQGDLVTNLVAAELGWSSPEILADYEEAGVFPLTPVYASGDYYAACAKPATEKDEWQGLQVRVGSPAALRMVTELGGSPVSIAGVEAYEALQRGTVDCTLAVLTDVAQGGFLEVAPHLVYPTTTSFPRVSVAILAGTTVESLPLAYRQILFDSFDGSFQGSMMSTIGNKKDAIVQAKDLGVEISEVAPDLQEDIAAFAESTRSEVAESGALGGDILERMRVSRETWSSRAEELGYVDGGGLADFDEWYDEGTDYRPIARELLEGPMLEHRPS